MLGALIALIYESNEEARCFRGYGQSSIMWAI